MQVIAIAAVATNGVIGSGDDMVWHLPEDWRRFKRVTMGHAYLEGRRTFEQLGLLTGRRIIVVTRNRSWTAEGVAVVHGVAEGLALARSWGESVCYVGGGAEIYAAAWEHLTGLDITDVHQAPEGAAVFPRIEAGEWRELSRDPREGFDFVRYAPITRTPRVALVPDVADTARWLAQGLGEWVVVDAVSGVEVGRARMVRRAGDWELTHELAEGPVRADGLVAEKPVAEDLVAEDLVAAVIEAATMAVRKLDPDAGVRVPFAEGLR